MPCFLTQRLQDYELRHGRIPLQHQRLTISSTRSGLSRNDTLASAPSVQEQPITGTSRASNSSGSAHHPRLVAYFCVRSERLPQPLTATIRVMCSLADKTGLYGMTCDTKLEDN
jgi:hypothetical protein